MIETAAVAEPEREREREKQTQVLPVVRCRLQVASCNVKDVAFAAHLPPKSQMEKKKAEHSQARSNSCAGREGGTLGVYKKGGTPDRKFIA